jgi:hypothetical protein
MRVAPVWDDIADTMNALMDPAIAVITEAFAAHPADDVPVTLSSAPCVEHAMSQGASVSIGWSGPAPRACRRARSSSHGDGFDATIVFMTRLCGASHPRWTRCDLRLACLGTP